MGLSGLDTGEFGPILICGVGSVGERHIRNAIALGLDDIHLYRRRNLPLRSIDRSFPTSGNLHEALAVKPKIAIICNPTSMHVETALACARAGCHLLIEKPLSHDLDDIVELETLVAAQDLRCMVAYMGRFHPCVKALRNWIERGEIGEIVHYRSLWGDYLPDWHPYEDYRDGYAARVDLGGGPTHTLSHELDLLYSFLGLPQRTLALKNMKSHLELQTEHGMDMLFEFAGGATANLHVDFFQKPATRRLEIIGNEGKVVLDFDRCRTELYSNDPERNGQVFDASDSFDRNDQFQAELEYFLECVASGREPCPNLADGKHVVEMALGALHGSEGP